ncbi:MAG: AbrB/MazE/SpoVT family DNA-binding domain-containing protein [Chloroflexi bacterium]|nr:AbrB/MazE/SpoVT family DNA-binding domain-containing protein [Chloroflexota bacterium]
MVTAKITSKGQITIPKDVRERLGLRPGDRLAFTEDEDGWHIRKQIDESPFEKWRGFLTHLEGRDVDELIEEMRGPPLEPELRD